MKTTALLNEYLSNLLVLNVKLHHLHWNVTGINFKAIHEYTEGLYDKVFEDYDAVAEHIKIKGDNPLVTVKDYISHATIEEVPFRSFTTKEVVEIVAEDFKAMKALAEKIHADANAEDDFETANLFEDYIASYNKELWFLKSMDA